MLIPETIGTVAALLSFIEFVMRLATFLSPQQKRALGEAQMKIRALNPSIPVEQAKSILSDAIQKNIPEMEAKIAQEDLSLGLEALKQYIWGLNMGVASNSLPMYGSALAVLCGFVGNKLVEWRCFEAWGHRFYYNKPKSSYDLENYLIPMPNSERAIRSSRLIQNAVPKSHASGNWYFSGALYQTSNPAIFIPHGLFITKGKYYQISASVDLYSIQGSTLNFADYEFSISQYSPIHDVKHALCSEVAERLATGLLGDLIDYSRRVRGEKQKSESMKSRLTELLKK